MRIHKLNYSIKHNRLTHYNNTIRIILTFGGCLNNRLKSLSTGFFAITIIAFLAGLVFVNISYIRHNPVEKKFLTPWLGMRTFMEIGSDPYGEPATQRTQLLFYGKLAETGKDPLILNQPFASEILYFPLALIKDYTTARVIWMVLLELFLIGSAFLCLHLFDWKLPIFITVEFIILAVFGTQALVPLLENDQVILIFILILVGLIGLQKGLDEMAGAFIALAFFQPSVTGILCLMIFWWAIHNHRLRVIWGGMITWGFLIFASFGLFPGWFFPFIRSFRSEFNFMNYQSTFGILSDLWPAIGTKVAATLTIGIAITLILEWRTALKKDFHWFLWVVSLTLATYPLVGLPSVAVNNIVLLIPFTYILKVISERMGGKKQWVPVGLFLGFFFLSGWVIRFGLLIANNIVAYKMINFAGPSLLLIAGLYWIRWWATRPPRTWMDTIDRELD
jgi:hypothetical protein